MLRSLVCTLLLLTVGVFTVLAGEYKGRITKIEDGKLTIKVKKEEKTLSIADDVTITNAKDKTVKLKGIQKRFADGKAKKGVAATVTTEGEGDAEKVTKIKLGGGKKKKKKDS